MKTKWTRSRGELLTQKEPFPGSYKIVTSVDKDRIGDENVGRPSGWGPAETVAGVAL